MVCEPLDRVDMEMPESALSGVLAALVRHGGVPEAPRTDLDPFDRDVYLSRLLGRDPVEKSVGPFDAQVRAGRPARDPTQ